ncbi:uncharacterized protein LOC113638042 isoform X1 [Tachysurus ichikawai]
MTKLEQLNVFLRERLSEAVKEILDTVSRMMKEYEEETARIMKENDYLKEMLTLTGWSFTELNTGVSFGKQDGMSNLQHEAETREGWCQSLEMKEESTSIKIEQPDPLFPAHPDSEHTHRCPLPVVETGSSISDVWNSSEKRKGKAKIKLKKKHYCLYCKKPSIRMAQHLLSAHANEPEVAKALSYDKKSKERKQLLDLLQSKGSLLHKDVGSKTLMSSNRHAKAGSNRDGVQCIYCLGLYSRKVIINHVKRCKHEYPYRAEAGTVSPIASTTASQPGASLSNRQLTANQASSPNSHGSCKAKQEKPNPECLGSHVSDTQHSAAQLYADTESAASTCEDFELVNEQLFAELESHDFTPDTRNSPGDDQYETSKSEDKETDNDLNSRNGHTLENRRSFHTQSKVMDAPSDEEERAGLNTQLHVCQHCSATFCSPYHLRRHEYTHTGERPFWCSECNVGFIQKYRYRNHRMIHHEQHISGNKDQPRRRKKRSCSGERPAESELLQQVVVEATSL